MTDFPSAADLLAEYQAFALPRFAEAEALTLGRRATDMALADGAPVVIDIRTPDRILFHAALPGTTPLNDAWIARKSATALLFQLPSLLVGQKGREAGNEPIPRNGLSPQDYADHGGAVPIRVAGVGVVACLTVSGLPQVEDHRLAMRALHALADAL